MQLLIIDVQNTYRKFCHPLINTIPAFAENFAHIVFLFDNHDGQEFNEEVPDEWMDEPEFYDRLNGISKQYGFFRGLMDAGIDAEDEEIVKLGKFMRKNKIVDARDVLENESLKKKYLKEFKHSPLLNIDFNDYGFYLPEDLIEEIESTIRPGVTLVGGARNECLKEVAVLLRVLDIDYTIIEEHTY